MVGGAVTRRRFSGVVLAVGGLRQPQKRLALLGLRKTSGLWNESSQNWLLLIIITYSANRLILPQIRALFLFDKRNFPAGAIYSFPAA